MPDSEASRERKGEGKTAQRRAREIDGEREDEEPEERREADEAEAAERSGDEDA